MTTAFSIGEALASGFKLTRRRPLQVWAWALCRLRRRCCSAR